MKKQINEIKKMQRLAGLITESEYQESMMNESNDFGNFEGTLEDFGIYDESTNTFEVEILQLKFLFLSHPISNHPRPSTAPVPSRPQPFSTVSSRPQTFLRLINRPQPFLKYC